MLASSTWWRVSAACLGFLADSYDLFAIDLVILILKFEYSISIGAQSFIVSMMLAGVIAGQLTFGFVADWVGRKWASVTTAGLTVLCALLSALCQDTPGAFGLPVQLGLCRFFLGLGVGGEYPLTASITAEATEDASERPRLLTLLVSTQGVGMLLPCCVALAALGMQASLGSTWRIMLAFGALPSSAAFLMRWQMRESDAFERTRAEKAQSADRQLGRALETIRALWRPLVGTAVTWFLMNIYHYSLGSFKSSILNGVMSNEGLSQADVVFQNAQYAAITSAFAIAGFAAGFVLVGRVDLVRMQLAGFLALTVTFVAVAVASSGAAQPGGVAFLVAFGVVFFFQNSGPNLTTFIIPADAFPTEVRATCHGLSAASGKLGAVVGTSLLSPAEASFGMGAVYGACAGVTLLGAAVTYVFTPRGPVDAPPLRARGCGCSPRSLLSPGSVYGSTKRSEEALG